MINAKKVLKKLRGESKRSKVNMYLDTELLKKFRILCEKQDVSAMRTIEELMSQYIEQTKRLK